MKLTFKKVIGLTLLAGLFAYVGWSFINPSLPTINTARGLLAMHNNQLVVVFVYSSNCKTCAATEKLLLERREKYPQFYIAKEDAATHFHGTNFAPGVITYSPHSGQSLYFGSPFNPTADQLDQWLAKRSDFFSKYEALAKQSDVIANRMIRTMQPFDDQKAALRKKAGTEISFDDYHAQIAKLDTDMEEAVKADRQELNKLSAAMGDLEKREHD